MKLHFEPDLDYQKAAIDAVCNLFRGQETCRTEFTVTMGDGGGLGLTENQLGIGNRLSLLDEEIVANLRDVQLHAGLRQDTALKIGDFTVEMETGTGKTYVYLRTIFELNKRFGFCKFVIVVPSVAIKEGVYKTLQITADHFRGLYASQPFDYFLYDSTKLGQVRNFATSSTIQIMVVTVGAINKKDVNNLYKDSEKTGGEKPIDLIKATCPIIIVDEPQSVDGGLGGSGKKALDEMKPLCTLRYSATHDKNVAKTQHMVYRLDAVDAYEKKLVKQIEVASVMVDGGNNKPYVRFVAAQAKGRNVFAQVELDVLTKNGVVRRKEMVQDGDPLDEVTGRDIYAGCRIGEIYAKKGAELLEVKTPQGETFLKLGEAVNDVNEDSFDRLMIRQTIKEHLAKERRLTPLGIKVLSLFFIPRVDLYRQYDSAGKQVKGVYATMFEEEYRREAKKPENASLFKEVDLATEAELVHEGYFSIDKAGKQWVDTEEGNQSGRDSAERAYNLIMKNKERLLSFDTKLKFIFSHSALREGWDNPNVFQICALREITTERNRRQTLGRGLRLCVNQMGARVRGFDVNTLTVIANESFEEFAENLQKEIEKDTGIQFGVVTEHQFANITIEDPSGSTRPLGFEESQAIYTYLQETDLLDSKGRVQDSLRQALKDKTLTLPPAYAAHVNQVMDTLRKIAGRLDIKNAAERKIVKTRRAVLDSAEFKALWDRIKHKTTYRVHFDNDALIEKCIDAIRNSPPIPKVRVVVRKADLPIGKGGVDAIEKEVSAPMAIEDSASDLPDLLTELQDRTQLTRRSLVKILLESNRLHDFKTNPQAFIDQADKHISRTKRNALVDGIKYQRVGDSAYYAQDLFSDNELKGYISNMLQDTKKSVYESVIYDSASIEKPFAENLEKNTAVKVYAKLPDWFKVPTPLGTYNPDWAILVETDGEERLYFVVETKGSLFAGDLREMEHGKVACGRAHFAALSDGDNPARFMQASTVDDMMKAIG
jgi:type III restriction enzyme